MKIRSMYWDWGVVRRLEGFEYVSLALGFSYMTRSRTLYLDLVVGTLTIEFALPSPQPFPHFTFTYGE